MRCIFSLFLVFLPLALVGCSQKVITETIDEFGTTVKTVSTAAVERDKIYADERNNRDDKTEKMYDKQGIKTKWGEYRAEKDGVLVVVVAPKEQTVRAPHRYQQDIETRPPDHRGWDSFDNVTNKATLGFFGWLFNDNSKASMDRNTTEYRGDYVTNSNSYNSTSSEVAP